MTTPLASIIEAGTKLWLDSVDPDLVAANRALGATGATSNPIIISDLVKTGRYDEDLDRADAGPAAQRSRRRWALTDQSRAGRPSRSFARRGSKRAATTAT